MIAEKSSQRLGNLLCKDIVEVADAKESIVVENKRDVIRIS